MAGVDLLQGQDAMTTARMTAIAVFALGLGMILAVSIIERGQG